LGVGILLGISILSWGLRAVGLGLRKSTIDSVDRMLVVAINCNLLHFDYFTTLYSLKLKFLVPPHRDRDRHYRTDNCIDDIN
jgi:hypothetical protein